MASQKLGSTKKTDTLIVTSVSLTADVTGTLPVANGGTGVTSSTGTTSVVLSASPTLTGTPLAPTATAGTNTTQIATTAFVQSAISASAPVVRGYIDGYNTSNNGAASQSIAITAGQCDDSTHAVWLSTAATFYKTIGSTWAVGAGTSGSPKGGLDTGTVTSSTWYHIFVIGGSGQPTDLIFSKANPATGPTLPSGYTTFRRIASVLYSGSAFTSYTQVQEYFAWPSTKLEANGLTGTGAVQNVSLANTPPAVSCLADLRFGVFVSGSTSNLSATSPYGTPSSASGNFLLAGPSNLEGVCMALIMTNTTSNVSFITGTNATTYWIGTVGYYDYRGRNT
jgi:hypothetical protein